MLDLRIVTGEKMMSYTMRILTILAVVLSAGFTRDESWAGGSTDQESGDNPVCGEALYRDVLHYSASGEHRTGTNADHQARQWLAKEWV